MKVMNYAEARREARKRFGDNAEVHRVKQRISALQYEVGVVIENHFRRLGVGSTWVKAFESVREGVNIPKESPDTSTAGSA